MAVTEHVGYVEYAGDDVDTTFDFDFEIFEETDLLVELVTDSDGSIAVQTLNIHFTVSATNNDFVNGGTVTMITAPATGETLIITRNLDLGFDSQYPQGGSIPTEQITNDLDRIYMVLQQHEEILDRCFKLPKTDVGSEPETPALINFKDKYLKGDSTTGLPTAVESIASGTVDITAFWETVLDDADAIASRMTLGVNHRTAYEMGADYTVLDDDGYRVILCTAGGTNRTLTLPTLADNLKRHILVRLMDGGNTCTIDGEGAETIDGATTLVLSAKNQWVHLVAVASEWKVFESSSGGHIAVASANYTVLDVVGDEIIIGVTTGASDRTITLPTLADNLGKKITITKVDSGAGNIILDGEGAETIEGMTTTTLYIQFASITVLAESSEWLVSNIIYDEIVSTDSSDHSQSNPVTDTWYNMGSLSIALTPGIWMVDYSVLYEQYISAGGTVTIAGEVTLSTANNSESDVEFTTGVQLPDAAAPQRLYQMMSRSKTLIVLSDTTYYLNALKRSASTYANIAYMGTLLNTVIRAVRIG